MQPNDTLRPLDEFLEANALELRHLTALANAGFLVPVVQIDGDRFIMRDEAQELIAKLRVRGLIAATSGEDGLQIAEVR